MKRLTKIIHDYLVESNKPDPNYVPKPSFRPSSLGSICLRAIFYSYWRVPQDEEMDAGNYKTFQIGDAYHDLLKKWVRANGLLIDYVKPDGKTPVNWFTKEPDPEFPCSDEELQIPKAKIDGIGIIDGKLWVYEFKSINDGGFNGKKYPSGFVLPPLSQPKLEHLRQAMLYPFLLEQGIARGKYAHIKELEGFTEVEGVIFLYINKNDGEIKEFQVKKSFDFFSEVAHDILEVQEHNENKTLPPKNKKANCRFCPWESKCKKNFNPLAEKKNKG